MENQILLSEGDDWQAILTFLPHGWEEKAKELGALSRRRNFDGPEALLRVLLIHLVQGCSLRVTSALSKAGGLASASDVALLKRLKASGEWMRWMAVELMKQWFGKQPEKILGMGRTVRVVDGSTVSEPGSTGTTWKIHYSIQLPSLQCDEVYVTDPKTGEDLKNFNVHPGDVFLADRGYYHRTGMLHVVKGGGDLIVRMIHQYKLYDINGQEFGLIKNLRSLTVNQIGDWDAFIHHKKEVISGRVCAIKKSKEAAEKAKRAILRENSKKGHKTKPETLVAAEYVFVFTTLSREWKASQVLEAYRGRWQVELAFKRLKSLIGLGHLKKTDFEGAKAWLHGKIFAAFLVEAMIAACDSFSPWGYEIQAAAEAT
ncbi:transposase IS4 family protein [Desulfatibacillum aliphaticivorans]|uniref:Transposase IS4 family protein n=1 Tax=Desulfatibacillum aliphaticivorans TaxID=218208 RepID=B8F976_DESAL|nr:IS4 family transposase [Desulfatibacillum aliphaticivorans]ACL01943.1 transposase IS4 family protein [Desulfatibacillum aliphaticivorans]ACL02822.1 transposase IS4 family protein [Desulfatibacillum aliphaticivorans]ACL02997.1 transposase IS4 family protein [Desulfatibacillum aliphaticivorans]ACL03560.1 transposase IS4 family protein [Desulfatibacillum aliphaticivorans]ACL04354.1 transposase IS4 family protein [Desulfatibacillum aliphaticivorans]